MNSCNSNVFLYTFDVFNQYGIFETGTQRSKGQFDNDSRGLIISHVTDDNGKKSFELFDGEIYASLQLLTVLLILEKESTQRDP